MNTDIKKIIENNICNLCPRECNVDRNNTVGYCRAKANISLARAALHYYEEPPVSGKNGSGAVFFSGCNLRCVFCQNSSISAYESYKEVSIERLSEIFMELQDKGANNINLVTPSHYSKDIIKALDIAKNMGLKIPIVYNSSAYEKPEEIRHLSDYIDVFLPDFKYMDPLLSYRLSSAKDYPEVAMEAIDTMVKLKGKAEFIERNGDTILSNGVIVRHLCLPGCMKDSIKIIDYLYNKYGDTIYLSIMNQYTPNIKSNLEKMNFSDIQEKYPAFSLSRKLTSYEYKKIVDHAIDIGVTNGFMQESGTSSESFIPDFDFTGI